MAIYLHAGQGKSIRKRDIIGIFDMDNTTVSGITRDFLAQAQKNNKVINITDDIPRAYILYGKKNERESVVAISQFSSGTLHDRLKRKI
jgi:hypothetical protein